MFEMYFVGQIRRFCCGGSGRLRKPRRFGSKIDVQVIRENVALDYWMYVPTDTNPADITTRLLSPNAFVSCEMWWKGPDFFTLKILICDVRVFLGRG